ncbi:hypothetical protein [Laribacter hongkongensis]|uniref:hypothetical protein n=1 Tax=Laribacter hongkongensis TaxID=168471 RepID=UPI001E3BF306|nr:hypothetical protein [Laribacter hongkongensis]MCG9077187.1 hypothetical protein [Laribacter hongkongensis]MCG9085383.1 hypothetical protein [Laribacter hongkongensis]MCG9109647.1 hypothetical protein [Laribacter hongkongensis]MCG9121429.1 hypothetical protein [Laribacter hongkongensis]
MRENLPWNLRGQNEQDAVQRCSVIQSRTSALARSWHDWQQWLQRFLELLADNVSFHVSQMEAQARGIKMVLLAALNYFFILMSIIQSG